MRPIADLLRRGRFPHIWWRLASPLWGFAIVALCAGCFTHNLTDFNPKRGMVCDPVRITGTIYNIGHLDGVWFNGIPANASIRAFPPPSGPLEILAYVPVGATTGPIRASISVGWGWVLGVIGTDKTFATPFSVVGSPAVPVIASFTANPVLIKEGASSTLQWSVAGPLTALTLNGANVLGAAASQVVTPVATTTYTLVATNVCLQRNASTTVNVIPLPKLTSLSPLGPYHPGQAINANGVGLTRSGATSQLVFVQGATTVAPTDPSPSPSQLHASVPVFSSGAASVSARVGSDVSNVLNFVVDSRQNGAFTEMKGNLQTAGSTTCGTRTMQIFHNPPGWARPYLAVFQQGTTVLAQHNFDVGPIGGAAFSPGCDQGVSVSYQPPGTAAPYLEVVERFGSPPVYQFSLSIMDGFTTVPERWHILFSPDDKIVVLSTASSAPGRISIRVRDMAQQRDLAGLIDTPCAACSLTAQVINGNSVRLTLDGTVLGTYPTF
jgi:hypothetical protein